MNIIKNLFLLLSESERRQAYLVLILILFMAFLDMLGVASIMPFVAVISNPEIIDTNAFLSQLFLASNNFGVSSQGEFIFFLGIVVFLMLVISLTFKAFTVYYQTRFSLMREYSIGRRLVNVYLNKPYEWFLTRHSADLSKNILSEVNIVIADILIPIMNIIAQVSVSSAIIILLLFVDPVLTICMSFVLASAYGLVFYLTKNLLSRIGHERSIANEERYVAVNEAFGASKEIKLGGMERIYLQRFSNPAERYARTLSTANLVGQLPRFALEVVTFGGLLLVILYLMFKEQSFSSALPIISLFAVAGYRLMPSLQGVYRSVTQVRFAVSALHRLIREFEVGPSSLEIDPPNVLVPLHEITMRDIGYRYPLADRVAVENLDLKISVGSSVGFVGPTGGGKTTTVDLLLGLLDPERGGLFVDGKQITAKNRRNWQATIGYVPQQIYLGDDTIAANIAFGVNSEEIDIIRVKAAAKVAQLDDFIENELPKKYFTEVGERGVRLSGVQKQRIGIARALYKQPSVLVLDEATSALDNLTEALIMKSLKDLQGNLTVVMIAHRLSTVVECDRIFYLEGGKLISEGTYDELRNSNSNFRSMDQK